MNGAQGAPTRTLLLAVDAVPYRVARAAADRGAFAGWSSASAMVAPFPSLTHASFATLFAPFGVAPSWGYELRHFDQDANRVHGGNPLTYRTRTAPWATILDAPHHGVVAKIANYVSAPRAAAIDLRAIAETTLTSPREVVVAYIGASDGLMHLYDDEAATDFLVDLDRQLASLCAQHLRVRARPLRIVLFSDHGCGHEPVHYTGSLAPLLRGAGLRLTGRLEGPADVVAPTFGIVNYAALYLASPAQAEAAATAVTAHPGVELAAFATEPDVVTVLGRGGRAFVEWRPDGHGRRFRYVERGGDVLGLGQARVRLASAGRLDADGYARQDDWLRETAFGAYPDPLRRLADALTGDRVASRATVLLSLAPSYSWGLRSAFAGAFVRGGRLTGTHGGLDRESTLGFVMDSEPDGPTPAAVPAEHALASFAPAVRAER